MKRKYIVVTGGAGFVGSHLIQVLIDRSNVNIISLDNYSSGSIRNHIKNKRVRYLNGETKNIFNILKLFYICKKYNLKKIANKLKETEIELVMIDGYISEKSNIPVLDWHVDQAYSGKKMYQSLLIPIKVL